MQFERPVHICSPYCTQCSKVPAVSLQRQMTDDGGEGAAVLTDKLLRMADPVTFQKTVGCIRLSPYATTYRYHKLRDTSTVDYITVAP
jgi:hypothetical protein